MKASVRRIVTLMAAWVGTSSCTAVPPETVWLRVELPEGFAGREKEVRLAPRIAEAARRASRGVLALQVKRAAGRVRIGLPGACPLEVDAESLSGSPPASRTLQPLFDVGPSERVVGVGSAFEMRAVPNCAEARALKTTWSVTGGASLEGVKLSQDGRSLRATTRLALPPTTEIVGVVPISARQQRELRSELTLRTVDTKGEIFEQRLGVSAVARSSGLPNVGLSHPVLLAGANWVLTEKPPQSSAALRNLNGRFELIPDVTGRYRLSDGASRQLTLLSGRYDETPLDCGRSDCHQAIATSAAKSPMTLVLSQDLGGCHALSDPACATACHATGEPGTNDGGFSHVARELGSPALPVEHDDLPRALRRLGGVGCLACHGPGAVPGVGSRWAVLRSDVCAVCHDAPPRYGHVSALSSSRMGHADHLPQTRSQPECARCHTTWGALGRSMPKGETPESFGLACATCHDVHPHSEAASSAAPSDDTGPTHGGLLRQLPLPASLPRPPASFLGVSRVCIACHAPSGDSQRPEASAAAILAGQGGVDPASGKPLELAPVHAQDPRGCLRCHNSGPPELVLGKSHAFRAEPSSCTGCHAPRERAPSLRERAQRLLARWGREAPSDASLPLHAQPTPQRPLAIAQERALANVRLVLEDPAADVHHPAYAKLLLDAAERFAPGAPP